MRSGRSWFIDYSIQKGGNLIKVTMNLKHVETNENLYEGIAEALFTVNTFNRQSHISCVILG